MRNLTISAGLARTVALVAVAGLAAVSCGKATQDAVVSVETNLDAHALAASADHTAQAGTGKVHLTMSVSGPATFTVDGVGAYDTAAGMSSMTIDLGSALSGILSKLPAGRQAVAGDKFGSLTDQKQDMVQHGSIVYLHSPLLSMLDPTLADRWIKVDAEKMVAAAGGSGSAADPLSGMSSGDPSAILGYLKGAGADVTTVGHEAIDGTDTTHVHATLSMGQALDAAGADRAKLAESLKKMPAGIGDAVESLTLPVDVYVDADGFVRRIAITIDTSTVSGSSGHGMTMTMTVDYSDFGQPVTITEPTADQTVSACDLAAHLPDQMRSGSSMLSGMC
jgi:hypothetical protein